MGSAENLAIKQSEDQSVIKQHSIAVALNMIETDIQAALAKLKLDPSPNTIKQISNKF